MSDKNEGAPTAGTPPETLSALGITIRTDRRMPPDVFVLSGKNAIASRPLTAEERERVLQVVKDMEKR